MLRLLLALALSIPSSAQMLSGVVGDAHHSGGGSPNITTVNITGCDNVPDGGTCTIPSSAAGSALLIVPNLANSGGSFTSFTTNQSQSAVASTCFGSTGGPGAYDVYYLTPATAGTTTITVDVTAGNTWLTVYEITAASGILTFDACSVLDTQGGGGGSSTPTSPSFTVSAQPEYIVTSMSPNHPCTGLHTGTVFTNDSTANGNCTAHLLATSNAAFQATWDVSSAALYGTVIAGFVAKVQTPTDSPGAGTYGSTQSVTLSDATSGSAICYTIDGSTPGASTPGTCDSSPTTLYTGAISVASTTTIKAIGTKAGLTNSGVLSSTYTISAGPGTWSSVVCSGSSTNGSALNSTASVSSQNCTGATAYFVAAMGYQGGSNHTPTITDGSGHTFSKTPAGTITSATVISFVQLFYVCGITGSATESFTLANIDYPSLSYIGVSGGATASCLDGASTSNSAGACYAASCTLPSITPSATDLFVVVGSLESTTGTVLIDSSFTIADQHNASGGAYEGGHLAYKISGSAESPSETNTNTSQAGGVIMAAFKP